jgi:hypothetical protein
MTSIVVLGQRRAVAELDATIGHVEERRREQLALIARLSAAGKDAAPVRTLLRLTEDYLACLRQSRSLLLWTLPQQNPCPGVPPAATGRDAAGLRPRLAE